MVSDECKTIDGVPCDFPFTYNGVSHTSCTMVESSVPWCATDPDSGNDYGICLPNCPIEEGRFLVFPHEHSVIFCNIIYYTFHILYIPFFEFIIFESVETTTPPMLTTTSSTMTTTRPETTPLATTTTTLTQGK